MNFIYLSFPTRQWYLYGVTYLFKDNMTCLEFRNILEGVKPPTTPPPVLKQNYDNINFYLFQ